jgi:hypothetical protein
MFFDLMLMFLFMRLYFDFVLNLLFYMFARMFLVTDFNFLLFLCLFMNMNRCNIISDNFSLIVLMNFFSNMSDLFTLLLLFRDLFCL